MLRTPKRTRRFLVGFTLLVAGLAGLALLSAISRGADVFAAADEQVALKVFADGYLLRAQAARNFDTSTFAQIYVDDASVPLTPLQASTLDRIAPGVPHRGLLTFHTEFYKYWQAGNVAAQRVKAAEDAKRTPDPADVAAAIPAREDPIAIPQLILKKADISATRAVLEIDSEPAFFRVTLLKQDGRWYIAGEDRTPHE